MGYDNFPERLRWVLVHEGGFVNHPKDPGGATNKGVTQRVYDGFRDRAGQPRRSVREIESDEIEAIYRRQYWDAVRGDDLGPGLDYCVFDFAVNSGPSRAAKFLQRALGVAQDGVIGAVTLGALAKVSDRAALCESICRDRLEWLMTLRTWGTFGRGWKRRIMGEVDGVQHGDTGVIDRSSRLARGLVVHAPTDAEEGPGKALEEDRRVTLPEKAAKPTEAVSRGAGALIGAKAIEVATDPAEADRWAEMLFGIPPGVVFIAALALAVAVFFGPEIKGWLSRKAA